MTITADDILRQFRIVIRNPRHGNQKTVCPECSRICLLERAAIDSGRQA
jgi:hypothetical protein